MAQTVVLTNVGKGMTAKQVAGTTSTAPKYLAVGTGAHTAAAGDTALTTEVETRSGTNAPSTITTTQTNDTFQVIQTITASAAHLTSGTGAIKEAGILDASTSGNLFLSATFDDVSLNIGDSLQLTAQVQYT